MIVIDTHAWVWMLQGDSRLRPPARTIVEDAAHGSGVFVPAIVAWEVGMLTDKGRIRLGVGPRAWLERALAEPGFHLVAIDAEIGADAGTLHGSIHGDPADRLIIATARKLDLPILTVDRKIIDYAATGQVRAIDARH